MENQDRLEYSFSPAEREVVAEIQRDINAQFARMTTVLNLIRRQQGLQGNYAISEDGARLVPAK